MTTTSSGIGRPMTSPPPPEPRPGNRALRVALLAATAVAVIAGLVAIVVLVPGHKSTRTTVKATTASPSTQLPSSSQLSSPTTSPADMGPSPVSSLGGLVLPSGDPQAALKTGIAAAFVKFNDVFNDMVTMKTVNFTPLTEVAADPLLPATEDGIVKLYDQGYLEQGRATLSNLTIQSIAPDGQSATLTACADLSRQRTIDAKTGAVVSSSGNQWIVDAATLRIRDGRWKVTGLTHPSEC